jgi:hypothetical protein
VLVTPSPQLINPALLMPPTTTPVPTFNPAFFIPPTTTPVPTSSVNNPNSVWPVSTSVNYPNSVWPAPTLQPTPIITNPTSPTIPKCNIDFSNAFHGNGIQNWIVSGSASNNGAAGVCSITVRLSKSNIVDTLTSKCFQGGIYLSGNIQSLYIPSGNSQSFSIAISNPSNTATCYEISII